MSLTSWIESLRARCSGCAGAARRRSSALQSRASQRRLSSGEPSYAEQLEQRTLLSVSALFFNGTLGITADGADSIIVRANAGGQVEVLDQNGILPTAPAVDASAVTRIQIAGSDSPNVIDLQGVTAVFTSLSSIVVSMGDGADFYDGSHQFGDSVRGQDGDDTIFGEGSNDTLDGGNGSDRIDGHTGDDLILGGDGNDSIVGQQDNDTIRAGNGSDTVDAGGGNDSVEGNNGEDSLLGGTGNDTLNGDGGVDTVSGGDGNDSILGGELNDSLSGDAGDDVLNGQAGNDTLDGGADDDNLLGGVGNDSMVGGDGIDTLNGNGDSDIALGGNGNDSLLGGSGNDSLDGENGDDVLLGQSGDDTLLGGGGADRIDGGTGNDLLDSADDPAISSLPQVAVGDVTVTEGDPISFGTPTSYAVPLRPRQLTSADFNNDGIVDLAGTTQSSRVSVLFGTPSGIFQSAVNYPTNDANGNGTQPNGIAAGDIDSDGDIDLVAATPGQDDISVLLNLGDGTFSPPGIFNTGLLPEDVALSDFDGDGDLDLAVALFGNGVNPGTLRVYPNRGDGTFLAPTVYQADAESVSLSVGDIDGDSDFDIVLGNNGARSVSVFLNAGDGTFANAVNYATGVFTVDVNLADIDSDGDLDVIAGGDQFAGIPSIVVLPNNGAGVFGAAVVVPAFGTIAGIVTADFDNDADIDIVATSQNQTSNLDNIVIVANDGNGTFTQSKAIAIGNTEPIGIVANDFNGDGRVDVAISDFLTGPTSDTVRVFFGTDVRPVANVPITLSAPSSVPVDVTYQTTSGTATTSADFVSTVGTIRFNPGETLKFVPVSILTDLLGEQSENVFLDITSVTNATIGDSQGQIIIQDDDGGSVNSPTISINDLPAITEGTGGTTTATFTVSLSVATASTVTVQYSTTDGTAQAGADYTATSNILTFPPGVTTQMLTVSIRGDQLRESDETFFVNLLNPLVAKCQSKVVTRVSVNGSQW